MAAVLTLVPSKDVSGTPYGAYVNPDEVVGVVVSARPTGTMRTEILLSGGHSVRTTLSVNEASRRLGRVMVSDDLP